MKYVLFVLMFCGIVYAQPCIAWVGGQCVTQADINATVWTSTIDVKPMPEE